MAKDRTPAEIKAVRRQRERRRFWACLGFFALWWALFFLSFIPGLGVLLWVGWLAFSGEFIVLYGLHEKALRKLADRPAVDYNEIRKLEKAERKTRPAAVTGSGSVS
jgi:fatty acid desaturase